MKFTESISERVITLLYGYWQRSLSAEGQEELKKHCLEDPDIEFIMARLDDKELVNECLAIRAHAKLNLKKNKAAAWAKIKAKSRRKCSLFILNFYYSCSDLLCTIFRR